MNHSKSVDCKWRDNRGFCHSPKTIKLLNMCMPCPNKVGYFCHDYTSKDNINKKDNE